MGGGERGGWSVRGEPVRADGCGRRHGGLGCAGRYREEGSEAKRGGSRTRPGAEKCGLGAAGRYVGSGGREGGHEVKEGERR